jgi:hypothetical protein
VDDAALKAWSDTIDQYMERLMAERPDIHPITARIIAGDLYSADQATSRVSEGEDPTRAYVMVGSYARWGWVCTMVRAGKISEAWFAENIAHLWRGADPDDTDPGNLALWKRAYNANGGLIRDGRPLPESKATDRMLKVFRGGPPATVKGGIAWTLDPKIARKFADGAGERVPVRGSVVVTGLVRPRDVIAYLTERGESEVIVEPRLVRNIHPTGE